MEIPAGYRYEYACRCAIFVAKLAAFLEGSPSEIRCHGCLGSRVADEAVQVTSNERNACCPAEQFQVYP